MQHEIYANSKNWNYFSANVDKHRRKIDNNLDKILGRESVFID